MRCAIAEPPGEVNLAQTGRVSGSAGLSTATYQQPPPNLCADIAILVSLRTMNADRITSAIDRIETALARIDAVRESVTSAGAKAGGGSAKVVELVNAHEKLREQVAESLRELDDLLSKLEDDPEQEDRQ